MNKKQSRQLDKILLNLIQKKGESYDIEKVQTEILPELTLEHCRVLFYYLKEHYPVLLYPKSGPSEDGFWATDFAKAFLEDGGFSKIYDSEEKENLKRKEREDLEIEKLKYDVRNSKRIYKTYWWTFSIAILAFFLSLLSLILKCI